MGIVAVATGTIGAGYLALGNTNAALETEIAAARRESTQMVALQTENQRLASLAAELETLRHDDAEFARLAAQVAEVKQANAQKLRVAQSQPIITGSSTYTGEVAIGGRKLTVVGSVMLPDDEQALKDRIAQLNREGNALVQDYKALAEGAKNAPFGEAKLKADADAAAKMEEIWAKQRLVDQAKTQLAELQRQRGRAPATLGGNGTVTLSARPSMEEVNVSAGDPAANGPRPSSITVGGGTLTFRPAPSPSTGTAERQ